MYIFKIRVALGLLIQMILKRFIEKRTMITEHFAEIEDAHIRTSEFYIAKVASNSSYSLEERTREETWKKFYIALERM